MTDEELRTFCLEQAVLIVTKKDQFQQMIGFRETEYMSLFEISEILYSYVKTGKQSFIPVGLSYLK